MKNLLFKKSSLLERVMVTLLFILVTPNVSWSQSNIYPPNSTRSFELPVISESGPNAYRYRPSGGTWVFYNQSGLTKNGTGFTWANPNAPLGNQVLFLQNTGYVETNFEFTTAGYYRFRFKAAWRQGCCETPKYIRVIVDGIEAGEVELRSKNYEEYWTPPVYLSNPGFKIIRLEGHNPSQPGDYTGFVDDFTIQRIDPMPNASGNYVVPTTRIYAIGPHNYNFQKLEVLGTLLAPQNQNVNITANSILVDSGGRFQMGQERSPYRGQAIITLNGTSSSSQHDHMGTKFFGAMSNGVIELHGKEKQSWTKLRETADIGHYTLKLVDAVDWEVGDQIVVAPSGRTWNDYEQRTISSISGDKKNITFSTALGKKHIGALKFYRGNSRSWGVDMRAEVGVLTRNIKIQGDAVSSNAGFGAHMMIMGSAKAYISGVELYRVGQSNTIARYPFHWHHGHNSSGEYFKNSSVHVSYNRALTIHRTNFVQVHDNFFFDHIGHGIFLEEGNEIGNDIVGNLVMATKRPTPAQALTTAETIDKIQNRGPAAFWITHPYNTVRENVATGTVGTGYWYIFPYRDRGGLGVDPQTSTWGSFNHNVAHSCTTGFDIFDELNQDESVRSNIGYLTPADFKILNCTWYSNDLGMYSGSGANWRVSSELGREIYMPNMHLIFDNNVFAENQKDLMQASNNQVINSLFVSYADVGNPVVPSQTLFHKYDGGGIVKDSHIVGYDGGSSSMMSYAGAAVSNGNFKFKNVTTTGNVVFNMPGVNVNSTGRFNATVYDEDGSLTGFPGSALVPELDFLLFNDANEVSPVGWSEFIRSNRRYENTRILLHLQDSPYWQGFPGDINVIRTKFNDTKNLYYGANGSDPVIPFVMNDPDLLYTYDFIVPPGQTIHSVLPQNHKLIGFQFLNTARANDFVIVRFKGIGSLRGLYVDMSSEERVYNGLPNLSVTRRYSMTDLKNYPVSAYYISGSDLYIKAYTNGDYSQNFNIKWGLTFKNSSTEVSEKTIYPNPATSQLFIKGLNEGEEVQIIDVRGRLIQTTTYNKYVDVSQLKSGMYILRTKDQTFKFIKE